MNAILAAARADLLERVRSFRFLAVLMATVAMGMLMLPTQDAGYVVLQVGQGRGIYNSAWVGLVFGVVGAVVLPLFGFFIIKDALARDRMTRVGLMLAATPISRFGYLGAKLLSNMGVFCAILAVSSVVAVGMQFWRAEDTALHPLDLLVHLWVVPLPVLLATSALALVFECTPGLRGAFGNVVFFFLWAGVFGPGMDGMTGKDEGRVVVRGSDFYGISAPLADFEDHLDVFRPGHEGGLSIGANIGAKPPTPVPWPGIADDARWLMERLAWSVAFVPLLLLAGVFFDRFDPARGRRAAAQRPAAATGAEATATPEASPWRTLTPLPRTDPGWRPLTQLVAELTLLLWRKPLWWYGIVAGFWIAALVNAPEAGLQWVVPLAWLFGITTFSEHGARADLHGTHSLLASAPSPLARQLPVQWLAGVVFALALIAPVLPKLLLGGMPGALTQVLVGAGFLSALALASGALSRGSRLFELTFLMLWYAAMQNAPGARFMGTATLSFADSYAPTYLGLGVLMLGTAWLLRALELRR